MTFLAGFLLGIIIGAIIIIDLACIVASGKENKNEYCNHNGETCKRPRD